eukprot:GHVU01098515.1.p1 GENE.GHVU01098515.1~~GHVU01098515.1.p1  ORF type:complete len:196 (-),score=19.50 GHVU01098515.1:30-617(-)
MAPPKNEVHLHYKVHQKDENSSYNLVSCKYCDANADALSQITKKAPVYVVFLSRLEKLNKHLKSCVHYKRRCQEREAAGSSTDPPNVVQEPINVSDGEGNAPEPQVVRDGKPLQTRLSITPPGRSSTGASTQQQLTLHSFYDADLTDAEKEEFINNCIKCAAANNLPATFFQDPMTISLFTSIRPGCVDALPSAL